MDRQESLKRNDVTQLCKLTVGARFYFQLDTGKHVYEVLAVDNGVIVYAPNKNAKQIRATKSSMERNVIFLRTINPTKRQ